jgi:hypothetical protein
MIDFVLPPRYQAWTLVDPGGPTEGSLTNVDLDVVAEIGFAASLMNVADVAEKCTNRALRSQKLHPRVRHFVSFLFHFVSFCFIFVSFCFILFHFCFILFHFCFIFVSCDIQVRAGLTREHRNFAAIWPNVPAFFSDVPSTFTDTCRRVMLKVRLHTATWRS